MDIYTDTETIPDQTPGARDAIAATLEAPSNYGEEAAAKWHATTGAEKADKLWRDTALDPTPRTDDLARATAQRAGGTPMVNADG